MVGRLDARRSDTLRRFSSLGLVLVGLSWALLPAAVSAQVCNGFLSVSQVSNQGPLIGSNARLAINLRVPEVTGGASNKISIQKVFFDLDCTASSIGMNMCTDEGGVISYLGDGTITTDCGVTWTTKTCNGGANVGQGCLVDGDCPSSTCGGPHPVGANPNRVVFTANTPVMINGVNPPNGGGSFCRLEFDVRKESLSGDETPMQVEQRTGYTSQPCDNGLQSSITQTSALPLIEERTQAPALDRKGLAVLMLLLAGLGALSIARRRA